MGAFGRPYTTCSRSIKLMFCTKLGGREAVVGSVSAAHSPENLYRIKHNILTVLGTEHSVS